MCDMRGGVGKLAREVKSSWTHRRKYLNVRGLVWIMWCGEKWYDAVMVHTPNRCVSVSHVA